MNVSKSLLERQADSTLLILGLCSKLCSQSRRPPDNLCRSSLLFLPLNKLAGLLIMPSSFPPTNIEKHHAQRRSGNYEEADLERGNYNDGIGQQPISNYPPGGSQEPQITSAQPTYNPNPNEEPLHSHYTPHPQQQAENLPPSQPTYDNPPQSSSSSRHNPKPLTGFLNRSRHGREHGTPSPGIARRPSPLVPKAHGGMWEETRGHLVAMSGEFLGTIAFLWFALSATQVAAMTNVTSNRSGVSGSSGSAPNADPNTNSDAESVGGGAAALTPPIILYIALAFGFSLAVNAWVFYRISGGLFNPAVVLGLCISGALPWMRGLVLVPAQILGAIIAAALVQAMFPGDVGVTVTRLSDGVSIARGLFIEMFCTAMLVFTILMLAAEKHQATFIAPIGIGLSLFIAELSSMFGPCIFSLGSKNSHFADTD